MAIYICIKMVSFGLMWSWKPNWGSLLPACLCNCSMDFTNHKGQNECDHPQQSIAHWFFSLYDSHKYWSSFFKQGGLLIYISLKISPFWSMVPCRGLFNVQYANQVSETLFYFLWTKKVAFPAGCETSSPPLCCHVSYCLVKRLKKEMLAGLVLVSIFLVWFRFR